MRVSFECDQNNISTEVNFAALILAQNVSKLISFMPLRPILFFFRIFCIILIGLLHFTYDFCCLASDYCTLKFITSTHCN